MYNNKVPIETKMADFKPKRKRNVRKRRHSSDSDDSEDDGEKDFKSKLEDIKEAQKLRSRQNGVSAASLALGKKIEKTDDVEDADPFKMKTGGFIDMKALKKTPITGEAAEAIGTAFAAETNRRDEDTEMLKYVEEELARRKGRAIKEEAKHETKSEDFLYHLPDHLQVKSSTKKTEDMLSNQMLSGIPEVDLGIEAKIKNIEATEEAKNRLIHERMRKKENEVSVFVPTNMAVNFVQHNRFNIEDTAPVLKKVEQPVAKPLRVGDVDSLNAARGPSGKSGQDEKATDDFHYEKFKKQMRRF